ncbi:MAG TPA: hypothetical protein VGJ02_10615 [Pyrinomonadaceae bacterium]
MLRSLITAILVLMFSAFAAAQKGIDTQTEKIKQDTNKQTSRSTDATRSFDWGKGKTKVRDALPNPYKFTARRDALIEMIGQALQENNILMDEAASRMKDGVIITQPFVFAKGPVTTQSELLRYGNIEYADTAWSRAQYTLTIEVQPVDGVQNNVSVIAKVEGRSGTGLTSEWRTVQSSGLAEDEFLAKLVEIATGRSPDEQPTTDH